MHESIEEWFESVAERSEFTGKKIVELGSRDVNGSLRPYIENWGEPAMYVGCDILIGPGVDVVCDAGALHKRAGVGTFDIVIATESLHAGQNWRSLVGGCRKLLKPGGLLYLTTRSDGACVHDFPYDYWRFDIQQLWKIFGDYDIQAIAEDPDEPGAFLKARKYNPAVAAPDLSDVQPIEAQRIWRRRNRTSSIR